MGDDRLAELTRMGGGHHNGDEEEDEYSSKKKRGRAKDKVIVNVQPSEAEHEEKYSSADETKLFEPVTILFHSFINLVHTCTRACSDHSNGMVLL
jgi:hypothetical protein